MLTGLVNLYRFKRDLTLTPNDTANSAKPHGGVDAPLWSAIVAKTEFASLQPSWTAVKGKHIGSFIMSDAELHGTTGSNTGTPILCLLSAPHYYHASMLFVGMGLDNTSNNKMEAFATDGTKMGVKSFTAATYGQAWSFYPYLKVSSDSTQLLYSELSDAVIICGNLKEDGICYKWTLTAPSTTLTYQVKT
jgi:hypothetical protein